jgi:hypothetical protein
VAPQPHVLGTFTRADAAIAGDVRHELEAYAGPECREVSVENGRVTLGDPTTAPRAIPPSGTPPRVIASSVRGVLDVGVVPAS